MGICMSTEDKELKQKNDEIDSQIKKDKQSQQNEIKMLLLGAGESGKSTILKQMKLLHDNGYSKEEKEAFREIIFSNIIQSMKVILEAMARLGIPLANSDYDIQRSIILNLPHQLESPTLSPEISTAVKALWTDAGVQECASRSNEYQLNNSARYYFDAIDRISAPEYVPNDQDVLRSRVKTIGICETAFLINGMKYRMFDVGGQRSERKKWIHCFENVTAVIFLAAISEYDQVLVEDETVNRMQEALTLFDSICNSQWFQKTSMILFLNKKDLFMEKLKVSPLGKYFPDYQGDNSFADACEFLQQKFVSLNQTDTKQVYCHFTCATDCDQIKVVMEAVYDIVVQANLRDCGLM